MFINVAENRDCTIRLSITCTSPANTGIHFRSIWLNEVCKLLLIERVIFKVLNKKFIQTSYYESELNRVVLKDAALKKFVLVLKNATT